MGTLGLLPWIVHPVFWALVLTGWIAEELSLAGVVIFVALWLAGFFLFPHLPPAGFLLFPSYVAVLDVVLVLLVLKSDMRLW